MVGWLIRTTNLKILFALALIFLAVVIQVHRIFVKSEDYDNIALSNVIKFIQIICSISISNPIQGFILFCTMKVAFLR